MGKLKTSNVLLYSEIALTVILTGIGFFYLGRSLVSAWKVIVPCVAVGFLCAAFFMRENIRADILRFILHGLFAAAVCFVVSLAANYHIPRKGELHDEIASVDQRFTKTRHRTKRVGRRVVAQGEPYKVYYVKLRFADGTTKDFEVPLSTYRRYSRLDTLTVILDRGILNIPVLRTSL